jgi:hypothetical protein
MTVTPRPRRHLQHHDPNDPAALDTLDALSTNTDAHALAVSATVRLLQHHLQRLRLGQATAHEQRVINTIVAAAVEARDCLGEPA